MKTITISEDLYRKFIELFVEVDYQVYSHWYDENELRNNRNKVKEALLKEDDLQLQREA
jgi:hypothetical protein